MITIGSTALAATIPFFSRKPKDLDYLLDDPPKDGSYLIRTTEAAFDKAEGHYIEPLMPFIYKHYQQKGETRLMPLTALDLLLLKCSHMHHDINWEKHMWDIQFIVDAFFLKSDACLNTSFLRNFPFDELVQWWNKVHGTVKKSDLTKNESDFFNNSIQGTCPISHEELHDIVKFNPKPLYQYILKDGAEVEPDYSKWKDLSHKRKVDLVKEEVMVMAYERYRDMPPRAAYIKMLKKYIRQHAPEWMFLWCILNYKELRVINPKYFNIIENVNSRRYNTKSTTEG